MFDYVISIELRVAKFSFNIWFSRKLSTSLTDQQHTLSKLCSRELHVTCLQHILSQEGNDPKHLNSPPQPHPPFFLFGGVAGSGKCLKMSLRSSLYDTHLPQCFEILPIEAIWDLGLFPTRSKHYAGQRQENEKSTLASIAIKKKHFAHLFSFYKITLELAQLVHLFDQKCNDKILRFVGCLYICLYI